MMYVVLNPIRAGISHTLEESDFTSIQGRLAAFAEQGKITSTKNNVVVDKNKVKNVVKQSEKAALLRFKGGDLLVNNGQKGLPFSLLDYFELIDWTGRAIRDNKKGAILSDVLPILQKLGVNEVE